MPYAKIDIDKGLMHICEGDRVLAEHQIASKKMLKMLGVTKQEFIQRLQKDFDKAGITLVNFES